MTRIDTSKIDKAPEESQASVVAPKWTPEDADRLRKLETETRSLTSRQQAYNMFHGRTLDNVVQTLLTEADNSNLNRLNGNDRDELVDDLVSAFKKYAADICTALNPFTPSSHASSLDTLHRAPREKYRTKQP